jgi:Zn-dependent protease with chaperone function
MMGLVHRLTAVLFPIALLVAGAFAVLYAVGLSGLRLADLPLARVGDEVDGYLGAVAAGNLLAAGVAVLALLILLGLVILVIALWPERPRLVGLGQDAYVEPKLLEERSEQAARAGAAVLDARARLRRAGDRPKLRVAVATRPDADAGAIEGQTRERVQTMLQEAGIELAALDVRVKKTDPRRLKRRVR